MNEKRRKLLPGYSFGSLIDMYSKKLQKYSRMNGFNHRQQSSEKIPPRVTPSSVTLPWNMGAASHATS